MTHLWLQVTVDVTELMELIDACKHFCCVESRVLFFEYPRVVQQSPEVASWNVLHGEIHMFSILERVQELH